MRPSAGSDIRIERPDEVQRRLLAALDGKRTTEQLEAEFGAEAVGDVLSQMQELGVVEDAADDERWPEAELARFDRQLRYFSDIRRRRADAVRMPGAAAGGAGRGLRSRRARRLGGVGTGLLRGRGDVAGRRRPGGGQQPQPPDPLHRGRYRSLEGEMAAERLGAFNSAMRIEATDRRLESEEEIAEASPAPTVVIDAADWPAHDIERWVNSACFAAGIPYITMSHFPPMARVGPLYVPGQTGCFTCQEAAYRRDYPLFDVAIDQRRAQPSPAATLGPACGLIGGQVGLDVMHHLTGLAEPSTLGVAHIYDLRTMEVEREPVVPEPDCPVCGEMQPAAAAAARGDGQLQRH